MSQNPRHNEFTLNMPHEGAWLCYVNGIEIPCPSITVNYGVWQIPEASLAFAPSPVLQRLGYEDRVEVVVFFLDTLTDPEAPVFRLLFEGELMGWSYANSMGRRMMTFNALADISIFLQMHYYFMNNVDSIVGLVADPNGSAGAVPQAGVFYPYSLFKKGLIYTAKEKATPDVERPFEILYNAVQGMIDRDILAERGSLPSVNFFARWAKKRNFHNRFAALPFFEDGNDIQKGVFPIIQAVQDELALQSMQDDISASVGSAGTIWSVLQEIYGKMMFEVAMLPTAPAFQVRFKDGVIIGPPEEGPRSTNPEKPLRLLNYFVKPQMLFSVPPTCNLITPAMISSLTYAESYAQQPTRFYVNDSLLTNLIANQNPLVTMATTVGYPAEINAVLQRQIQGKDQATASYLVSNARNVLVFPEEFFRGPISQHAKVPAWFQLIQNRKRSLKQQQDPEKAKEENQSLNNLFDLFAEYEFFRQKYEKRGGSVDIAFNPFVVPGFPMALFDERSQQFDITGYLMSVTQTLQSVPGGGTMRTSLSYSFGRTFGEMFELLAADMARVGIVLGSAPMEPVDQIRQITQDFAAAEEFYNALFFGRQELPEGKKASFDFRDAVGYAAPGEEVADEEIYIDGPTNAEYPITYLGTGRSAPEATGAPEASKATQEPAAPVGPEEAPGSPAAPALDPNEVEAMARIIASEAGSRSRSEQLAVGWTARNRFTERGKSIYAMQYPWREQKGSNPPFSSRQPATAATRALAREILSAPSTDSDPTGGATGFFEPVLQDAVAEAGALARAGGTGTRVINGLKLSNIERFKSYNKNAAKVREDWSKGDEIYHVQGVFEFWGRRGKKRTGETPPPPPTPLASQVPEDAPEPTVERPATNAPGHNLTGKRRLQPRESFLDVFCSYDAAMQYVARPICTLEEYIKFLHGVDDISALMDGSNPQVEGPNDTFVYGGGVKASRARYYTRIRRLIQGPAQRPADSAIGATLQRPADGSSQTTATPYTGTPTPLPADFAQTRDDWDRLLEEYRYQLLTDEYPRT